jgi:hypothetical protein
VQGLIDKDDKEKKVIEERRPFVLGAQCNPDADLPRTEDGKMIVYAIGYDTIVRKYFISSKVKLAFFHID